MSEKQPDELSTKLRAWQVQLPVPRGFQAEVWQRIAGRQATQPRSVWNWLREWFLIELGKPQYATALIAVSVALSLGFAHLNAAHANARHWRSLEARYVISITPLGDSNRPQ